MDKEKELSIIIYSSSSYLLYDRGGQEISSGEATAQLDEENLRVLPKLGEALLFPFRDIIDIVEGDYRIHLTFTSGERLVLFNLGYRYEDFLSALTKLRNELLLKDMLMKETLKKSGIEAELAYFNEGDKQIQKGECEVRLYETAIVILPPKGEPVRIPYSDLSEMREEDHRLVLNTEYAERIVLSKMGDKYDEVVKILSDLINALSLKVQLSLKELLPEADPSAIRRASRFMKEGRAAKRSDIQSVSPELWTELEKKLEGLGIKNEYDFLKSFSQQEKICIGLKRGLLGDLTREYIWFLIPIYSVNPAVPGNAVAIEATSEEGEGRATYFFRIVSRKDYPNFRDIGDLHRWVDTFIRMMNRSMISINFRREPIYLPDSRLRESQYEKYRFAILKLPALQTLRSLFIGRVIHSSPEQWRQDVLDLLKFNVSTQNDNAKWQRREQTQSP